MNLVLIDRLSEEFLHPCGKAFLFELIGLVSCQSYYLRFLWRATELHYFRGRLYAIFHRHIDVHENQSVRLVVCATNTGVQLFQAIQDDFDSLLPVQSLVYFDWVLLSEDGLKRNDVEDVVINEQNAGVIIEWA